jgi:hypothetical protein
VKSILQIGGFFILLCGATPAPLLGQTPEILRLRNKSFEAPNKYFVIPPSWTSQELFLGVKKVKELRLTRFYRKEEKSHKGNNHLALATYKNGTRENVGQKLRYPIIPGHRYSMDIWLAWSPVRTPIHPIQHIASSENDLKPVKLQLYGFFSASDLSNRLLAETGKETCGE